jgi:hypothetical protein
MDWTGDSGHNNVQDPYRLTENACWPQMLSPNVDPGYALNDYDNYYQVVGRVYALQYRYLPAPLVTRKFLAPKHCYLVLLGLTYL